MKSVLTEFRLGRVGNNTGKNFKESNHKMKRCIFNKWFLSFVFFTFTLMPAMGMALQNDDGAPAWAATANETALAVSAKKVIVLDPGHGGRDQGINLAPELMEKDVDLSLALAVKRALGGTKNLSVILTRNDDKYYSNLERVMIGNRKNADVFVSLHCMGPALKDQTDQPIVVYINRYVRDDQLSSAVDENLTQGVKALPWALAQNGMLKKSRLLGERLVASGNGREGSQGAFYTLPLAVLDGIHAPAVLVEVRPTPELLDSKKRDQEIARLGRILASGIKEFLF